MIIQYHDLYIGNLDIWKNILNIFVLIMEKLINFYLLITLHNEIINFKKLYHFKKYDLLL